MENKLLLQLTTQEFEQLMQKIIQDALKRELQSMDNSNTLLNIQEAASLLNLAVNTIYEKTSERTIPFYKHGKKIMFKKSELLAWVESRRVPTIHEIRQQTQGILMKKTPK